MAALLDHTHKLLLSNLTIAQTFAARSVGLLKHSALAENEGLWIHRCNSIHTFFMKFSIDCVFLDKAQRVKAIYQDVKPWRLILPVWGARSVIEMNSGKSSQLGLKVGDQLYVGN